MYVCKICYKLWGGPTSDIHSVKCQSVNVTIFHLLTSMKLSNFLTRNYHKQRSLRNWDAPSPRFHAYQPSVIFNLFIPFTNYELSQNRILPGSNVSRSPLHKKKTRSNVYFKNSYFTSKTMLYTVFKLWKMKQENIHEKQGLVNWAFSIIWA